MPLVTGTARGPTTKRSGCQSQTPAQPSAATSEAVPPRWRPLQPVSWLRDYDGRASAGELCPGGGRQGGDTHGQRVGIIRTSAVLPSQVCPLSPSCAPPDDRTRSGGLEGFALGAAAGAVRNDAC
jgi:hypothetical protein